MKQVINTGLPAVDAPLEWAVSADGIFYTAQIPIRAEGTFPNTEFSFNNLEEFRAGLVEQKHLLTRSIAEGLFSYGLGRHVEFSDQQALDAICAAADEQEDRLGDLIFEIIQHPAFRRADAPGNPSLNESH